MPLFLADKVSKPVATQLRHDLRFMSWCRILLEDEQLAIEDRRADAFWSLTTCRLLGHQMSTLVVANLPRRLLFPRSVELCFT